jgi:predicted N-acetyltransferase YhbS
VTAPFVHSVSFDPTKHRLDRFRCGQPELDTWLVHSAAHAESMRTARTFVWLRHGHVVAYYSLAAHALVRDSLPNTLGRGSPDPVPALLLAKLALDEGHHGRGLGELLLLDALRRIVGAVEQGAAARFVVVDALDDDAARFYERYGFTTLPNHPLRLVRKMSDVVRTVVEGVTLPVPPGA